MRTDKPSVVLGAASIVSLLLLGACTAELPSEREIDISETEAVLIQCLGSCAQASQDVQAFGGTINKQYNNVNAFAADIPIAKIKKLERSKGIAIIAKDSNRKNPTPPSQLKITHTNDVNTINVDQTYLKNIISRAPADYNFNNAVNGATTLHEKDITGEGIIVAIIDSGTANNADLVPALSGSVIGGENFVTLENEPSATSTLNHPHGTWVGSMIAGHASIILPDDAPLAQTVKAYAPESILAFGDGLSEIPLVGSAPNAQLYALKVFSADGNGSSSSTVLEAMDRVLTLKRNFKKGMPVEPVSGDGSEESPYVYDSLNIQVVNMSLGGPSIFPGYELDDLMVRELLKEDIAVVTSAGNSGFVAMTTASPSSSVASISVGAAHNPTHERIIMELILGPGAGILWQPNDFIQTTYFSARGPLADGRVGVDLVANGTSSLVQGADGDFSFVDGTSFSSPTVAGGAALLRQAYPMKPAEDIRQALIDSANPDLIGTLFDMPIDRGNGYLDLAKANMMLMNDEVEGDIPELPKIEDKPSKIADNIDKLKIKPIDLNGENFMMAFDLPPGDVKHFFIESTLETKSITITLENIMAELPLEQQNALLGDSLYILVNDAPTSVPDYLIDEQVFEDASFTIDMPETGLVRVALLSDNLNAGKMMGSIKLSAMTRKLADVSADGSLRDNQADIFDFKVKEGETSILKFELSWNSDWGQYPSHDIDLIVIDPDGFPYFDGATLDIPERMMIEQPIPGNWTAVVTGFDLHGFKDKYELRVSDQDNERVKLDD